VDIEKFDVLAKDVAQLKEITERLNKYMHVKVEISELNGSNVSIPKDVDVTKPPNLSEGIRMLLREKGVATSTEVYNFFAKQGWEVNRKTKNTLRSLFSMLKKKGEIEGDAINGFRLKTNRGV